MTNPITPSTPPTPSKKPLLWIILGFVVFMSLIGGCLGDSNGSSGHSSSNTTSYSDSGGDYTSDVGGDNTDSYLTTVRDYDPVLEGVDDSTLISLAQSACTALDNGYTISDVLDYVRQEAPDADTEADADFMIGAGVTAFCPQHADEL